MSSHQVPAAEVLTERERNPEAFYDEVLAWRPPLPVDQADFDGLFKPNTDPELLKIAPGYAWDRLPRWITEIESTFKGTVDDSIFCIDLCSSIPLNAQMLRGLEFKRSGERGHQLIAELFNEDTTAAITDPDVRAIHLLVANNSTARRLLEALVQNALYTRNSYDMAGGDAELAAERFTERLKTLAETQSVSYVMEDGSRNIETRWGICFHTCDEGVTYTDALINLPVPTARAREAGQRLQAAKQPLRAEVEAEAAAAEAADPTLAEKTRKRKQWRNQRLQALFIERNQEDLELAQEREPIGEELAHKYLDWQASVLAGMIAGNARFRPARFLSLDMAPRAAIANSSLMVTSEVTQGTHLFSHAIRSLFDRNQHIAADMFAPLPVPDNSVTFITCYDAWPFCTAFDSPDEYYDAYSEPLTDREVEICIAVAVDRLHTLYKKLTYGGKLVIFPWATYDNNERSTNILRRVSAKLSLLVGHGIDRPIFHYAALQELMSEEERSHAADLSNIFSDEQGYAVEALIVTKPHRGLVERHAEALGRRMLIATQIPD